jgi:hypothetical protein
MAEALERFGARASTCLLPQKEASERWSSLYVAIPARYADVIAAILLSLPRQGKQGRRKLWSKGVRAKALNDLLAKKPIRALAREISELTGQPLESTRKRLQEMNAGDPSLAALRRIRVRPGEPAKIHHGKSKELVAATQAQGSPRRK